ncbi:hypothetical protein FGIG_04839 [Fasciola gigantica]|uniref:Uncharacterized protein n=1 Tax=Fasciola gigantica TaxID=46835 RepID=A0A504YML4_FASGI|nr:hypothetical protein FGIG_04839 [Fasciola gigantica]
MGRKRKRMTTRLNAKGRLTPTKTITKIANSAVHRATELINSVRTRLESPGPIRRGSFPPRRASSADRVNVNLNNAEMNSFDTCSMLTTSTSSSAHSGFLNFTLPTTVNPDDPLPLPTCRLGPFQAEWLGGPNATWRLVTQDATMSPLDQANSAEPDLKSLTRANKALKKEQAFLQTKLNILCDELAKRTALVHRNEHKLEKLRGQVRHRMPEHLVEGMRSDMRRELEKKLEAERMRTEKNFSINLTSEDETNQEVKKMTGDNLDSPIDVSDSPNPNRASGWKIADEDTETTERTSETSRSGPNVEESKQIRKRVDWSESTTEDSVHKVNSAKQRTSRAFDEGQKSNSDGSNASTKDDETGEETDEHDTTGEESHTVITKASDSGSLEDEDEGDDESEPYDASAAGDGEDEENVDEEELEEEETGEDDGEEEEEELSNTDESSKTEGRLSSRPRVVQFGKVSRR